MPGQINSSQCPEQSRHQAVDLWWAEAHQWTISQNPQPVATTHDAFATKRTHLSRMSIAAKCPSHPIRANVMTLGMVPSELQPTTKAEPRSEEHTSELQSLRH